MAKCLRFLLFAIVYFLMDPAHCALKVHESFETAHFRPSSLMGGGDREKINQRRSARFKYREFAETEFQRPGYFPVPYVVGGLQSGKSDIGDLRTMPIPSVDLSQLIRQHISHQREKLLKQAESQTLIPSTILEGVSRITELRQTPFRRFPDSSPAKGISYQEKRRRWKAELNRQLRGPKVPPRPMNSATIDAGSAGNEERTFVNDQQTLLSTSGTSHYYVTYSPQTRIYQVSKRPPPNFNEKDASLHPATMVPIVLPTDDPNEKFSYEIDSPAQADDHSVGDESIAVRPTNAPLPPLIDLDSSEEKNNNDDSDNDENNGYEFDGISVKTTPHSGLPTQRTYLVKPEIPTTVMTTTEEPTTTTPMTTSTASAPIVVVKEAETIPQNLTFFQKIRVASERPPVVLKKFPTVKQILRLDDYYQEMEDPSEEDEQVDTQKEEKREETNKKEEKISSTYAPTKLDDESDKEKLNEAGRVNAAEGKILSSANSREDEQRTDHINTAQYNRYDTDNVSNQNGGSLSAESIVQPTVSNFYINRNHQSHTINDLPLMSTTPFTTTTTTATKTTQQQNVNSQISNNEPQEADQESDEEEEDDDDDLFFWKPETPANSQQRRSSPTTRSRDTPLTEKNEPFEILAHRGVKRIYK